MVCISRVDLDLSRVHCGTNIKLNFKLLQIKPHFTAPPPELRAPVVGDVLLFSSRIVLCVCVCVLS